MALTIYIVAQNLLFSHSGVGVRRLNLITVFITTMLALSLVLISCQIKDPGAITSVGTPSSFSQNLTALDTPKHYRMEFTWPPELSDTRNSSRTLRLIRSFEAPGFGPRGSETEMSVKIDHETYSEEVSSPGSYSFTLRDTEAPGSPWDGREYSFTVPEDCVLTSQSTIETRLSCGRLYLPKGPVFVGELADHLSAFQIFASPEGSRLVKQIPEKLEPQQHNIFQIDSHAAKGRLIIEARLPPNGKVPVNAGGISESFQMVVNSPEAFSLEYQFPEAMLGQSGTATAVLGNEVQVLPRFKKSPDLRGVYRLVKPVKDEWFYGSDWMVIVNTNYLSGMKSVGTQIHGTDFHQPLWDIDSVEIFGTQVKIKGATLYKQSERDRPEGGEEFITLSHKVDLELERVTHGEPGLPPAIETQLKFAKLVSQYQGPLRAKRVEILHGILQKEGLEKLGDLERFFQLAERMPTPSIANYYRLDRRVLVDLGAIPSNPWGEILTIHPGPEFDPEKAVQQLRDTERRILNPRQF